MSTNNNSLSESKLVAFTVGQQKKTRFQKDKEAKEKQKIEDEQVCYYYNIN